MAKPGSKITPAHLSFLALYSPTLSESDETFHDQIVYYYSKNALKKKRRANDDADADRQLREEENEKLRQIGLAQGLVGFAKSFSGGENVDSVETEKSRIVMSELEKGWWVLASVELTRLPKVEASHQGSDAKPPLQQWEYSSREVSPPALLLRQLHRAHRIFLLHHGSSLNDLYIRLPRDKFCAALDRFWTRFIHDWDVLLHGSPAVDIFGGLKLASGGELGIGVGEEEWGSGEREVLEGFASRTDGLVDLMVARFGEPSQEQEDKRSLPVPPLKKVAAKHVPQPWMGVGEHPKAPDGVFFSGIGALSRTSLRDIADWVEWIYASGEHAYGVKDNPTSERRKRRRRPGAIPRHSSGGPSATSDTASPGSKSPRPTSPRTETKSKAGVLGIPPPIVSAVEASLERASEDAAATANARKDQESASSRPAITDPDMWMKVLTLGYSSGAWSSKRPTQGGRTVSHSSLLSRHSHSSDERPDMHHVDPEPEVSKEALIEEKIRTQATQENQGHFIIGLQGDLEADDQDDEDGGDIDETTGDRILLRTIQVEVLKTSLEGDSNDSSDTIRPRKSNTSFERLRVIIYVHRPFIYTFLFEPRTQSLNMASFYRNLHTYLSPLHKPLSASTSPARVAERIAGASHLFTTSVSAPNNQDTPIWDLVFDPKSLTIHSSIPSIPEPGQLLTELLAPTPPTSSTSRSSSPSTGSTPASWNRLEALNVHTQILATVLATRKAPSELERTAKTSRGFWIVWMRLTPSNAPPPNTLRETPPAHNSPQNVADTVQTQSASILSLSSSTDESLVGSGASTAELREAFLVRRARDAAGAGKGRAASRGGGWTFGLGGGSSGKDATGGAVAGWGPARLAEGIGIDARRYVEGLLSLNR